MSARALITEHLDLWTGAVNKKSSSGRGRNGKVELTGVKKLRGLILELAVQGKLVEQYPAEEPASKLLERARTEKLHLVKQGEIKKRRRLTELSEMTIPFHLPSSWEWAQLEDVGRDWGQKAPSNEISYIDVASVDNLRGATTQPSILSADEAPSRARKIVREGTLIYSTIRPYLQNIAVIESDIEPEPIASTAFAVLHPLAGMPARFFLHYLRSPAFVRYVESVQTGIAYPAINDKQFFSGLVPVPPLQEQHRIVQKVDELMAVCDRLEQQTSDQIEAHETLVDTLLGTLTQSKKATELADNWARLAAHFDTLFTTEQSIDKLKQTIRQLAVIGKLTQQDNNDEPVTITLNSLSKLPKPARYESRSIEIIPGSCGLSVNDPKTQLSDGWSWVPLIQVAELESGHTPSRSRLDWWDGDIPWIGITDARDHNGGVIHETHQKTNEDGLKNSAARLLPAGTVCFSRTASVGYVVIMGRSMATSQDFVNWVPTAALTANWLKLVLMAERPSMNRFSKGAVHQTIYYSAWLSMHIALPPVSEQKRIIQKVDELIALCDHLKERLNHASDIRCQLADSVVEGALNS